jgi:hypothetical protein
LCMVLLAAQNEEALLRLVPRFGEAALQLEEELKARSRWRRAEEKHAA